MPTRTGRLAWLTSDTGSATREASALVSEILADMQREGIEHPRAATWATKTSSWRSKTPSRSSARTPSSSWGTCRDRTIGTSERAREQLGLPVYAVPITADGEVI